MKLLQDKLGFGDSFYFEDVIPFSRKCKPNNSDFDHAKYYDTLTSVEFFTALKEEVQWHEMRHKDGLVPRLISIQGYILKNEADINGFRIPMYRHPFDNHPPFQAFSPIVLYIKKILESDFILSEIVGTTVHFNHVLIQYYRNGHDYISEHADKTLDVLKHSVIVNVSFGVSRILVLKPKKIVHIDDLSQDSSDLMNRSSSATQVYPELKKQKINLKNNSMFVLGWDTNRYYLHSVPQNKSLTTQQQTTNDSKSNATKACKSAKYSTDESTKLENDNMQTNEEEEEEEEEEHRFNGERISLTFRTISTFLHHDGTLSGQGAPRPPSDDVPATAAAADSNADINSNVTSELSILAPADVPVCIRSSSSENCVHVDNARLSDCIFWIKYRPNKSITDSIAMEMKSESIHEKRLLLAAFSAENRQAGALWEDIYNGGFGVW